MNGPFPKGDKPPDVCTISRRATATSRPGSWVQVTAPCTGIDRTRSVISSRPFYSTSLMCWWVSLSQYSIVILPYAYSTGPEASASGVFVLRSMPNRSLRMSRQRMAPPETCAVCPVLKSSVRMGNRDGIPDESAGRDTMRLFMSITSFRKHPGDKRTMPFPDKPYVAVRRRNILIYKGLRVPFRVPGTPPLALLRLRINRNIQLRVLLSFRASVDGLDPQGLCHWRCPGT